MKKLLILVTVFIMFFAGNAFAVFDSGSTGADGPFNPPTQVPPGTIVNGINITVPVPEPVPAHPDAGIFNFTSVNVPSGVTVTFTANSKNTPVYILASEDVTIVGTIDISGVDASNTALAKKGGPGGHDGGYGGFTASPGGKGLGPGGGEGGPGNHMSWGGGGGFATVGGTTTYPSQGGSGGEAYGMDRLIPLVGGSGGGGSSGFSTSPGYGGAGGGGALLIASSGTISITGSVLAIGGDGYYAHYTSRLGAPGSGGAIKLVANSVGGNGTIAARGGSPSYENKGGDGRIRIEANTNSISFTDPPYTYGQPGSIFLPNAPTLSITAIAGVNIPSNTTGSYSQPDIMLPSDTLNPVTVDLVASYIPVGTQVTVSVIPQYGSTFNYSASLSGTEEASSATASVDLSTQYANVIMAKATYLIQQAMYWDGEKIEKVRVAAMMGKRTETVYITESGREIKAQDLIARVH